MRIWKSVSVVAVVVGGVLTFATSATAAPINYSTGFEMDPVNTYGAFWYNPESVGGAMLPQMLVAKRTGEYGLRGFADGSTNASTTDLTSGYDPEGYMQSGEVVVPTASSHILVTCWVNMAQEKACAAQLELSYGEGPDSHAPVGDGSGLPAPLGSPINVLSLASARAAGLNAVDCVYAFNGTEWIDTGLVFTGDFRGRWRDWSIEIAPDVGGVQFRVTPDIGQTDYSSWISAPGVTMFDHFSIRSSRGVNAKHGHYDDLAIIGGEVTVVPEPTAAGLGLFGLSGLLVLVRRRR